MPYDASNPKAIRAAAKRAAAEGAADSRVLFTLMSSAEGRAYVFKRLERSFVFSTPFTGDNNRTNFNLGVQNVGLLELSELMRVCPDQFILMLREANDKEIADGRRNSSPSPGSGSNGYSSNGGWDDSASAGSVTSEYDPGDGTDAIDGAAEG